MWAGVPKNFAFGSGTASNAKYCVKELWERFMDSSPGYLDILQGQAPQRGGVRGVGTFPVWDRVVDAQPSLTVGPQGLGSVVLAPLGQGRSLGGGSGRVLELQGRALSSLEGPSPVRQVH